MKYRSRRLFLLYMTAAADVWRVLLCIIAAVRTDGKNDDRLQLCV